MTRQKVRGQVGLDRTFGEPHPPLCSLQRDSLSHANQNGQEVVWLIAMRHTFVRFELLLVDFLVEKIQNGAILSPMEPGGAPEFEEPAAAVAAV